jgi:hypothetical protein
MPRLSDVLTALRQFDVSPEEISIPTFIYSYLVNEAQRIVENDNSEESDEDGDDTENE